MYTKQVNNLISSIEQNILEKYNNGVKLLSKYESRKLSEKELWKVNFQMDSLEIDMKLLKNKSVKIKKLQNRLNEISKELQEKNNTLSQLRRSKQYYNDLLNQNIDSEANKTFQDCLNIVSQSLTNIINEIKNLGVEEVRINKQLNELYK